MNKESILKRLNKTEDRLLVSKVLDKAEIWLKSGKTTYSDFLDPHQQQLISSALSGADELEPDFDGGFPGAERAAAVFCSDFYDGGLEGFRENALKIVSVRPAVRCSLSHRDYLGALMAIGIKREKTGDIIVSTEKCDIVAFSEMAGYIASNLLKVGSYEVSAEIKELTEVGIPEPKVREINVTVASLRLDCISAPGFGMSRSKAAEFIKAGKLSLNWEQTERPDRAVKEGDTISIRGRGRLVIEKVGSKTRKDRTGITLKKYI